MVSLAAQMVDSVIPKVRIRQWVITFPYDIRYLLAWNHDFRSKILAAIMRGLERHYVKRAIEKGGKNPKFAGISVVQRMDSACRLNLHANYPSLLPP